MVVWNIHLPKGGWFRGGCDIDLWLPAPALGSDQVNVAAECLFFVLGEARVPLAGSAHVDFRVVHLAAESESTQPVCTSPKIQTET